MSTELSTPTIVHVAVGLLVNANDEVLIARRASHQHQGGLWEFPGGKVEEGETVEHALARELREELDIELLNARSLLKISHQYSDKHVLLDVWLVDEFLGEARSMEGQPLLWVKPSSLHEYDFPAANEEIVLQAQKLFR